MSALFQHGLRHQFVTTNPVPGLARQSAKRRRDPDVLTADEIREIMKRLSPLHRTMVFLAAATDGKPHEGPNAADDAVAPR